MSGTTAHAQRKKEKRQKEVEQLIALNNNRTALLTVTIAELTTLYGADNVNANHPLFAAIQASANGSFIDLERLAVDITVFKTPETE